MSLRLGDIAPDFKAKTSIGDISLTEQIMVCNCNKEVG